MSAKPTADDFPTLVAIGAAVAITASLAHEAVGHGIGCLADGGTVALLTFLVFRCDGAGVLADGGGPFGAFLIAAFCLIAVRWLRPKPSTISLFGFALGVQMMLWVFAQMVREGIDGSDDWGHVTNGLGWMPGWHLAVIAIGIIGYVTTVRIAVKPAVALTQGRPARLLIPYVAACIFGQCGQVIVPHRRLTVS